jgi:hypothetical protein
MRAEFLLGSFKGNDNVSDLSSDGNILLKWMLKN